MYAYNCLLGRATTIMKSKFSDSVLDLLLIFQFPTFDAHLG